ncbi:hypothetical protein SDC9_42863 [bioreactor metagenome]|uniref:Uncharacterized protein n=1 Tax=bioreactor metagenome TaxID=1076179 RepID=A0A644VZ27_9ZZZZ
MDCFGQGFQVLDGAEETGGLDHQGCGIAACEGALQGLCVDPPVFGGQFRMVELPAPAVGAEHVPRLGIHVPSPENPALLHRRCRENRRLCGGGGSVVHGGVGDLHACEFTDHGLVLEDGLEGSLGHFRLVGSVARGEFSPGDDAVHGGGDEMVIDARTEEAGQVVGVPVAPGQFPEVPDHLRLRKGLRKVREVLLPDLLRDTREKIVNGADAEVFEHPAPVFRRGGNVPAHGGLSYSLSASSSSTSLA